MSFFSFYLSVICYLCDNILRQGRLWQTKKRRYEYLWKIFRSLRQISKYFYIRVFKTKKTTCARKRKSLIINVDQLGLEPRTSRL